MYPQKILNTILKTNVWQWVRRIIVLSVGLKKINLDFQCGFLQEPNGEMWVYCDFGHSLKVSLIMGCYKMAVVKLTGYSGLNLNFCYQWAYG